jgi:small subunit ribosomal protein S6
MPLYEHIFLARQDISGQQVEALVDQFRSVIEQNGGTIGKVEGWGLKSLAYRVRKNRKAHFTLMNIDAPPAAVAEMERQQRLNEDILRILTLRVDEHETGPSAMMQKRDRDDRRSDDRRGGGRFGDRDRGPPRVDRDRPPREDSSPIEASGDNDGGSDASDEGDN